MNNDDEFLRPAKAALYLDSSTSTLAKLRLYGGGPMFSRIGRAVRYKKTDLAEFMAATAARSTTEKVRS